MQDIELLKERIQIVTEFKEFLEWKLDKATKKETKKRILNINKILEDIDLEF